MSRFPHSAASLRSVVALVCGLLDERKQSASGTTVAEDELRFELVSCILGSQVRAESANAAADRLRMSGLLSDDRWTGNDPTFEDEVRTVLTGGGPGPSAPSYRFPIVRAQQLAKLRTLLSARPLRSYVGCKGDARHIRRLLVHDLPGVGPKQASMFLRNVGVSYDVAVLDVHVLKFLQLIDVLPPEKINVSGLVPYERIEDLVRGYAESVGRALGHLDWAIWITMRAAKELRQ